MTSRAARRDKIFVMRKLLLAVSLFAAPLAQAARVIDALRVKAEQDPSILAGGAGVAPAVEAAEATESVEAAVPAEAPAEAPTEATADVPAEASAEIPTEAPAEGSTEA